jgi:hypothetical protein
MVRDLYSSIKELENQGHKVTIRGFIWIQGESDSTGPKMAIPYQSNLQKIVNHMRSSVSKNSKLPIVLGVDEQYPGVYINSIVNNHKSIAKNNTNILFTSMIGLEKHDVTHLTPKGMMPHGERIYEAMKCLLENPTCSSK